AVLVSFEFRIPLLISSVSFWVGGLDVLFSCQDYAFPLHTGLLSIPRYCGIGKSLWIARAFHILLLLLLIALIAVFGLGKLAIAGIAVVAVLLGYEHSLV